MNKKFLTATCLVALAIILGAQKINALTSMESPKTIAVTNIPDSGSTHGCTVKSPCKYPGVYAGDVRTVCISNGAANIGAGSMVTAGAHFNYRLEQEKYRCYGKFLPASNSDGARIYCGSGSIARFHAPDNKWDFRFNSLGKIAIQNPNSTKISTATFSSANCYVYFEGNSLISSKLGIFGRVLPTGTTNENIYDAYIIEDNTTNPRVGGKAVGIAPTAAVKKAAEYLKTGVK